MQQQPNIIDCYNKTAKNYAVAFMNELETKPFDRMILKAFALENTGKGKLIDLGCGPGQTTKFIFDCGMTDIVGTDISPAMIDTAKHITPAIEFETADILHLHYADKTFGSAIAFYAIVHFNYEQVKQAFEEISRVLNDDGQFLFSFHIGNEVVHRDNFLEQEVDIDFYFFETEKITTLLKETGFKIIDAVERAPYASEYPSKRAYIRVNK